MKNQVSIRSQGRAAHEFDGGCLPCFETSGFLLFPVSDSVHLRFSVITASVDFVICVTFSQLR